MNCDPTTREAVKAWCKPRGVRFVSYNQYRDTRSAAERRGLRAPSGLLIHMPRKQGRGQNRIIYVIWYGESVDRVEETVAFFRLAHPERTDIRVVSCCDSGDTTEPLRARDVY